MLISKAYIVNEVKMDDCYADLEVCCFDVLSGSRYPACRFFNIYRPPGSKPNELAYMSKLLTCLT